VDIFLAEAEVQHNNAPLQFLAVQEVLVAVEMVDYQMQKDRMEQLIQAEVLVVQALEPLGDQIRDQDLLVVQE
jgi:hypothetical protein